MQRSFRKIHSVSIRQEEIMGPGGKIMADWVEIRYQTRMGNIALCNGVLQDPSPALAWLIEKAREAGKIK